MENTSAANAGNMSKISASHGMSMARTEIILSLLLLMA